MSILTLIGNTPVVRANGIYVKLEYLNPTGSHKDRTALYMVKDSSKNLERGKYLIEYTSGNTGISVAFISKIFGYKSIILVPRGTSQEKINIMKLLGAEIKIIEPEMDGHKYAEELASELGGIFLNQSENMANFKAHYETTGPEILKDIPNVDCFVMGVGTGGTVYGVGKYLKERRNVKIYALVPKNSYAEEELLGKRNDDKQVLEGLSYHHITELFRKAMDKGIIDEILPVGWEEAKRGMILLASKGIIAGPTSGANYYIARKVEEKCGTTVTIAADSILRYPQILNVISDNRNAKLYKP